MNFGTPTSAASFSFGTKAVAPVAAAPTSSPAFAFGSAKPTAAAAVIAPVASSPASSFSFGATASSVAAVPATTTAAAAPVALGLGSGFSFGSNTAASTPALSLGASAPKIGGLLSGVLGSSTAAAPVAAAAAVVKPLGLGGLLAATPINTALPTLSTTSTAFALGKPLTTIAATGGDKTIKLEGALSFRELEENIGKWTKELEADESLFLEQATKVNSWDRLLMENGNKITELNLNVSKVKADQQNLEAELAFIDTQQTQLEEMLIPCERMLGIKAEDGTPLPPKQYTQHSDVEREHTYKMSLNIDLQLKRINHDLKTVIEYVNRKNSTVGSKNPMDQILRIINAHIDSLQWIEKSTGVLQQQINDVGKLTEDHKLSKVVQNKLMF